MNFARIFNRSESIRTDGANLRRRALLQSGGVLAGAAVLLGSPPTASAHHEDYLTLDVACDGRTWRMIRMDPTAMDELPKRGDTFIVSGKIYPAGTIESGLSGPDQVGSIGTWVCRGWFNVEDITTETPHVATVQLYNFDDGNGLVSEGLEGGVRVRRAITGGMGRWADTRGDMTEEEVGENDTLLQFGSIEVPAPNIRFVFSMTPRR